METYGDAVPSVHKCACVDNIGNLAYCRKSRRELICRVAGAFVTSTWVRTSVAKRGNTKIFADVRFRS